MSDLKPSIFDLVLWFCFDNIVYPVCLYCNQLCMQSVSGQWAGAVPALFIILGNNNINTIFETEGFIQ